MKTLLLVGERNETSRINWSFCFQIYLGKYLLYIYIIFIQCVWCVYIHEQKLANVVHGEGWWKKVSKNHTWFGFASLYILIWNACMGKCVVICERHPVKTFCMGQKAFLAPLAVPQACHIVDSRAYNAMVDAKSIGPLIKRLAAMQLPKVTQLQLLYLYLEILRLRIYIYIVLF